jgi:hypothetical protein
MLTIKPKERWIFMLGFLMRLLQRFVNGQLGFCCVVDYVWLVVVLFTLTTRDTPFLLLCCFVGFLVCVFFQRFLQGGVDHSSFRGDCAALIPGQLPALARKLAGACDVLWKYSSGKEIESCFLLLCSLVRSATADERGAVALALSASVAQQSGADIQLRSRLLATLFNFFPAHRFVLLLEFVEQVGGRKKFIWFASEQIFFLVEEEQGL